MQTATDAFAALVEGLDQTVDYEVTVTFPDALSGDYDDVTPAVLSIDLPEQITGSAIEATTQINGLPNAACTLTLSGEVNGVPVDQLFNNDDPDSPMWGLDVDGLAVEVKAGIYSDTTGTSELLSKFLGATYEVASSNGIVTITCIDNTGLAGGQAYLPPVITQAPENAGLTSEFAVDWLLRNSSPQRFYSWPSTRNNCQLAAGFRSSIWPEVGSLLTSFVQAPVFTEGQFGTALGSTVHLIAYELAGTILTTDRINIQLLSSGDFFIAVNDDAASYQVYFQRIGNTVYAYCNSPSGAAGASSWSVSAGYHLLEYSATWAAGSATISGTVYIDGTSHSFTNTATDTRPVGMNFTRASVGGGPIEGVQITNESSYTPLGSFTPTLLLDPSLNPLTALPDVTGKTVPDVLQEIADAEDAVIGLVLGKYVFRNRDTIKFGTSQRDITSATSLLGLDTSIQRSMVRNRVQIPVNSLDILPFGLVWALSDVVSIPAGSTYSTVASMSNPIVSLGTTCVVIPNGGALSAGQSGYRAARAKDGSGGAVTNLVMTVEQINSASVALSIYNPNPNTVWLVSPSGAGYPSDSDGRPSVNIWAQAVTPVGSGADTGTESGGGVVADVQWPPGDAASNKRGELLLTLEANDWVQDLTATEDRATALLSDLHNPKRLYLNVRIVADPRLQIGDRVTLKDPDVSKVDNEVLIIGIQTSLSNDSWEQSIDCRGIYRPRKWILGRSGYSELGQTTNI